jgi:hypothetical protein
MLAGDKTHALDVLCNQNPPRMSFEKDDKIVLNVGGIRYQTTLATIRSLPDTLLGRMFSESNAALQKREKDGCFFFDRNGRLFEPILDAYRCGGQVLFPSVDRQSFERELEFWGLSNSVAVAESENDEEPPLFQSKQNRFNLQVDNCHADAFVALLQAIHNTFSEIEIRFDFNPNAESLVSFAAWSKSSDGSRTKTFFTCSVADYVFCNASVFPANEVTIVMRSDRRHLQSCVTNRSYDFSISSVASSPCKAAASIEIF